ncbi:hypothetical protein [Ochrobactrum sp. MYb379]|uniref:hypothetical protein n=1 Tax=Ochrobactrum sp. MYb379 TaxID=2745275 RepID=UPI0030AF04F5
MADPIPLSVLFDLLPVVSAPWVLKEQLEYSGLGTGEVLAAKLAPSRWSADVVLAPMVHTKARAIQAKLEALDGPIGNFYFASCTNSYPAKDPGGVKLGSASPRVDLKGANNKSLSVKAIPANYKLSAGDMLSIDYGSNPVRRYLGRLVSDATASANGVTGLFEIRPHLPAGIVANLAVNFLKPAAKVFIVPDSLQVAHSGRFSTISFSVMQRP